MCICIYVRNERMDQESSGVAHTSFLEGQQPVLQDNYYYNVDVMQQKMPAISVNPAYQFVTTFESPKHGTAPTAAASAK